MTKYILWLSILVIFATCKEKGIKVKEDVSVQHDTNLLEVGFSYDSIAGIGREKGVNRRDPSDIIMVDGVHYIWYTKLKRITKDLATPIYPEGYYGTIWYATSKDEGYTWQEQGMALDKGEYWDSFGVFTPNILKFGDQYYLYYTGVQTGFTNTDESAVNETAIGVAVADSPNGPWERKGSPLLQPASTTSEKFDSFRVDDAALMVINQKFYLYYKGRQSIKGFAEKVNPVAKTKMGLAVSDRPDGNFVKWNEGNFIQDSGHEVAVWSDANGYYSMASSHGNNGNSIWYSKDGEQFKIILKGLVNQPAAPGLFRPELTGSKAKGLSWGIAMARYDGDPYLHRFTVQIN